MSVFTPNKPQPGDNPSQSQDVLLQDFLTLEDMYGTTGDHYPWTNTTSVEGRKHAKVTMPGLPTTNPPGNVLPQPAAGACSIFAQTQGSGPTAQTTPFVVRDGLVPTAPLMNIWPLLPIKAFATFTTVFTSTIPQAQTINLSFNVTSITRTSTSDITIIMPNAMRTVNYGILFLGNGSFSTIDGYTIVNETTFTISTSGTNRNNQNCTIVVLEP